MKYWQIVKRLEDRLEADGWPQETWSPAVSVCRCGCGEMKIRAQKYSLDYEFYCTIPRSELRAHIGEAVDEIAAEFQKQRPTAQQ